MNSKFSKIFARLLVLSGVLIVIFSKEIVFPGLERLVGIDTIVGRQNVVYQADGSYVFTNPSAMVCWVVLVAAIGIIIFFIGTWLLLRVHKK